ncbi:MAG: hypothetical protein ABRQ26_11330 [Syntrophomonadaceae bacterium]
MRIDNQPPVYALTNSSANQNVRPNTPQPETVLNTQSMKEQNQEIQQKQDNNNEAVKNQIYNSSGQANRLPGTVTLFDTTA